MNHRVYFQHATPESPQGLGKTQGLNIDNVPQAIQATAQAIVRGLHSKDEQETFTEVKDVFGTQLSIQHIRGKSTASKYQVCYGDIVSEISKGEKRFLIHIMKSPGFRYLHNTGSHYKIITALEKLAIGNLLKKEKGMISFRNLQELKDYKASPRYIHTPVNNAKIRNDIDSNFHPINFTVSGKEFRIQKKYGNNNLYVIAQNGSKTEHEFISSQSVLDNIKLIVSKKGGLLNPHFQTESRKMGFEIVRQAGILSLVEYTDSKNLKK